MTEILAIIPARGGSKSIERKNIKLIADKPMIYYSIRACQESKYINRFVVSTEDAEIKTIAQLYGAQVIDRPQELAKDETKTVPVMMHSVVELEKLGYKPDYIALIQPTSPFRDAEFIDKAFEFFLSNEKCDSCFSAFARGVTHGNWRQLKDGSYQALYDFRNRPRRQDTDRHYNLICENGAFYAIKYDIFKKIQDFVGENPCVYLNDMNFDIDEPKDFELAEKVMREAKKR